MRDITIVEGANELNVQLVPIALVGWVLPTGHIDPSGRWYNPEDAYDGNINTDANPSSSYYNQPLELTLDSPIYCNKVKICADSYGREHFDYCAANVKVEVYYDGAYHTIQSLVHTLHTFFKLPLQVAKSPSLAFTVSEGSNTPSSG
ncbi:unnamed protein product [marine sediment metagenome]|uniref:Uncharacterized protein n=1 Tax=marine sediment metagenome TaxID=412755 RepID=X1RS32_9ZZZZ